MSKHRWSVLPVMLSMMTAILLTGSASAYVLDPNDDVVQARLSFNDMEMSQVVYLQEIVSLIRNDELAEQEKEDLFYLTDREKEVIFDLLREQSSAEEYVELAPAIMRLLDGSRDDDPVAMGCGNYTVTDLEGSYGGGRYYYADQVYTDSSSDPICGPSWEFPKDWIVRFPVGRNTLRDMSTIRIWATNWTAQCAIDGCVRARVYDSCTLACIGYWDAYFCWANPWTLKSMYLFTSSSIPDCEPD